MKLAHTRRKFIRLSIAASLSFAAGCGTILYPERRYQPPGGRLDWGVVALNTLGLLFFFIPGVIAFAVDFTTGAIYLPPPGYGDSRSPEDDQPLVAVHVPKDELTSQRLEQVASEHSGQDVRLVEGQYETTRLSKLADFWPTWDRLLLRG
jgi:hypothetical protein